MFTSEESISSTPMIKGLPKGTSTIGSIGVTISAMVGMGMISMPVVFARLGWVAGSILMVLQPLVVWYITIYIYKAIVATVDPTDNRPVSSFTELGKRIFNVYGNSLVIAAIYLEYGLFLSFLMLTTRENFEPFFSSDLNSNYILLGVTVASAPLALIKNAKLVSKLAPIGLIGITGYIILLFYVSIKTVVDSKSSTDPSSSVVYASFDYTKPQLVGVSLANITLVYAAAGIIPSVLLDMKKPEKFPFVISVSFLVAACIFISIGVIAYLGWGTEFLTGSDFSLLTAVQNYGMKYTIIQTVAITMVCVPQFGITAVTIYDGTDKLFPNSKTQQILFRLCCHCLQAIIIIAINNLQKLIDVISSFTNILIVIIFPALFHFFLNRDVKGKREKKTRINNEQGISILLAIYGFAILGFGSYSAIEAFVSG
jgi:solute carrier family 36 (proton-coupled amino acid transporter)